ncbi:nucleotidyltransferase family protein [Mesorhizobium sp. 1B3]|uniref:nucleotidyltransferase family protein n=1 Tax=Mesorhizobium sp. 1B3 TaxID=3243599 RepID=UPI003D9887F7
MTAPVLDTAMVLAAGLGKRMRPITDTIPKPLVKVAGRTLLDWALDGLAETGVTRAVVNVHYFPEQIVAHVAGRQHPRVAISDESAELLDSAGGIVKALPLLGASPFFILNADTFWIDGARPNLPALGLAWNPARMDILLMLADMQSATGHSGKSDFLLGAEGRLQRSKGAPEGLIYAGAAVVHPRIFDGAAVVPQSLNLYFDRAIEAGRLFGWRLDGHWITVGTPDAIPAAEAAVKAAWEGR